MVASNSHDVHNDNIIITIPRKILEKADKEDKEPAPTFPIVLDTRSEFQEKLGIEISKGAYSIFYKDRFSKETTLKIKTIISLR